MSSCSAASSAQRNFGSGAFASRASSSLSASLLSPFSSPCTSCTLSPAGQNLAPRTPKVLVLPNNRNLLARRLVQDLRPTPAEDHGVPLSKIRLIEANGLLTSVTWKVMEFTASGPALLNFTFFTPMLPSSRPSPRRTSPLAAWPSPLRFVGDIGTADLPWALIFVFFFSKKKSQRKSGLQAKCADLCHRQHECQHCFPSRHSDNICREACVLARANSTEKAS